MSVTYTDIVDCIERVQANGETVCRVFLDDYSMNTFIADAKISEDMKEKMDQLDQWSMEVERADENYLVTASGTRYDL